VKKDPATLGRLMDRSGLGMNGRIAKGPAGAEERKTVELEKMLEGSGVSTLEEYRAIGGVEILKQGLEKAEAREKELERDLLAQRQLTESWRRLIAQDALLPIDTNRKDTITKSD
jgi:hypothetical protein